jgi:uncharacterized membrane protein YdjX (TVP38/TMEM64 family)
VTNLIDSPEEKESAEPSRRPRWRYVAGIVVVMVTAAAVWQIGPSLIAFFQNQERVRTWLAGFGRLAPLISISLNTAQVLIAPVPGQVIGLANGYLFGVFWGTIYSLAGVTLGSAVAMALGRRLGRPVVQRFASPHELDRWDELAVRRGPAFFFLVFLLPLLPDDILCFAIGLSPVSIPYVLILAAIGRLPGLVASSWIGANASALSPAGWVVLGAGTLALAGIVLRRRTQLESSILRLAELWSERRRRPR